MRSMFSPDSWLMAGLSRIADLVLLNLLFILCSLPIVTLGAASAAMYTVLFRMGTQEEAGTVLPFFRAFRDNLKQGVVLWLIELVVGIAIGLDVYLAFQMEGVAHYLYIPLLVLGMVGVLASGYVFPLISLFRNSNLRTIGNAILMSIANLPRSVLIALLNLLPLLVLLFLPVGFLQYSMVWVGIYFALAAYLDTRLLKKVFSPFLTQEEAPTEVPVDAA